MAIQVQCPKCGWDTTVEDDRFEGTLECDECGIRFLACGAGKGERVRIGTTFRSDGQYGSLAVFAGLIMLIGLVQGIVIMVVMAEAAAVGILMGAMTIVTGIFTGLLILAVRDVAIRSRQTQEMVVQLLKNSQTVAGGSCSETNERGE
jgi:hypothetical protein